MILFYGVYRLFKSDIFNHLWSVMIFSFHSIQFWFGLVWFRFWFTSAFVRSTVDLSRSLWMAKRVLLFQYFFICFSQVYFSVHLLLFRSEWMSSFNLGKSLSLIIQHWCIVLIWHWIWFHLILVLILPTLFWLNSYLFRLLINFIWFWF